MNLPNESWAEQLVTQSSTNLPNNSGGEQEQLATQPLMNLPNEKGGEQLATQTGFHGAACVCAQPPRTSPPPPPLGMDPTHVRCPYCSQQVTTQVYYSYSIDYVSLVVFFLCMCVYSCGPFLLAHTTFTT